MKLLVKWDVTFTRRRSGSPACLAHDSLLLHYQASHPDVVATYSLSGPLLSTSALGHTAVSATQDTPASQSLAHMSATQKLRIVDMDQMSDDERNSEADEEEQRQEEALESEVEQNAKEDWDMEDAEPEVARWGVVIVKSGDLDGVYPVVTLLTARKEEAVCPRQGLCSHLRAVTCANQGSCTVAILVHVAPPTRLLPRREAVWHNLWGRAWSRSHGDERWRPELYQTEGRDKRQERSGSSAVHAS